jgi:hypothetical protein
MTSENKNESKRELLNGIDAISAHLNRSISTIIKWVQRYDFPARKAAGKTWTLDLADFRQWSNSWGYTAQTMDSDLERLALRKHLEQAKPKVITGDLNQLAKRLYTSVVTLMDYRKIDGCPLVKGESNQWRVDLNSWELWRLNNKLGPYAETGKHKGRVPIWT